ncbi:hypothetical protein MMC22_005388 [Lobaria immixta]|nr:hypothetical protein [Lobaria immixta]
MAGPDSPSDSSVNDGDNDDNTNASQPTLKAAYDPQTTHLRARSSLSAQSPQPPRTRDGLVEIKLPPAKDSWDVFGDAYSTTRLSSTTSLAQYDNIVRQFHCWLQLLVRGLNFDESRAIFMNTLPAFAKSDQFLSASYVELHLILQLEAYANRWMETAAGIRHREQWNLSKSRKSKDAPRPEPPVTPADMLVLRGLQGFRWTKDNVVDFWLPWLAGVQIIETGEPSVIGWLAGDHDLTWCKALGGIALAPMARVIASPSFMLAESDDKTKGHSNDEEFSDAEEAENASIGAIPTDTSPDLERSVGDAETMENHIVARLPHYAKAADVHRSETTLYHARLVSNMASKHDFPYGPHNLTTYRAPPVTAALADQIGLHYGHASFEEKHLIHVDHVQMEIHRLDALMDVILRKKKALETDIDNLRNNLRCKQEKF